MADWRKTPSVADLKAEETLKGLSKKKQVCSSACTEPLGFFLGVTFLVAFLFSLLIKFQQTKKKPL